MEKDKLIPASEFCRNHHIELSFVRLLHEHGLLEITTIEENIFIPDSHLCELEKMVRLYFELDINLEGIEAIHYLLKKIEDLQNETRSLRNRLKLYEANDD